MNLIYFIGKRFRKILYIIYEPFVRLRANKLKLVYGVNVSEERKEKVLVSLTSYPKRFNNIELCLKTIFNQSYKPDRIILWLGNDTSIEDIEKLKKYQQFGLEIKIDENNNYYSHKKYIYSFSEFSNYINILMDDDLIYPKNTIKKLIKMYRKFPDCIIAHRVHKIEWNGNEIKKYNEWSKEYFLDYKPSLDLCATTGAGTLFPPNSIHNEYLDFNIINSLSKGSDDLWLKFASVMCNIETKWDGSFLQMPYEIIKNNSDTLASKNVSNNENDVYINRIMNYFNITKDSFNLGGK